MSIYRDRKSGLIQYCPFCGTEINKKRKRCPQCKKDITVIKAESEYTCNVCGADAPVKATFCWNCGERFEESDTDENKEDIKIQEYKRKLITKLPKAWIGYIIAAIFLFAEVSLITDPYNPNDADVILNIIAIIGWVYWLFCIYKIHVVLGRATNWSYPISPGKSFGYNIIPIFNFYWLFKWTNEVANFVNLRIEESQMSKNWPAIILLIGIIVGRFIDGTLAMIITFSVMFYIVLKVKKTIQMASDIAED